MKTAFFKLPVLLVLLSALNSSGSWESLNELLITDNLELGVRISQFKFTDDERITYDENGNANGYALGISTYRLEELQDYVPTLYANYKFTPYVSLLISWEYLKGRAWTLDKADPHYDGDVTLHGPSLQILGRYPNETVFTPYAGVGIVRFWADFEEEKSWYNNGSRRMYGDDTDGLIFTVGCSVDLYENAKLELMANYLKAESDAYFAINDRLRDQRWKWPVDSIIYSLGVTYAF